MVDCPWERRRNTCPPTSTDPSALQSKSSFASGIEAGNSHALQSVTKVICYRRKNPLKEEQQTILSYMAYLKIDCHQRGIEIKQFAKKRGAGTSFLPKNPTETRQSPNLRFRHSEHVQNWGWTRDNLASAPMRSFAWVKKQHSTNIGESREQRETLPVVQAYRTCWKLRLEWKHWQTYLQHSLISIFLLHNIGHCHPATKIVL